jgi:A/G-specific adenine glycosylase
MDQTNNYNRTQLIYTHLMEWFDQNKRDLPWRLSPRTPYRVWISEIMLQQTQVETVIPYFDSWMETWPEVVDLAEASEDQVLKAWEGLGYYSRARNILKTARIIADTYQGVFPSTYKELIKLPGIGPYTAAAIASYTSEETVGAVDANVLRVLSRLNQIEWKAGDPKSLKACQTYLSQRMEEIKDNTSDKDSRNFQPGPLNEALIELGALICKAKTASCDLCPLQKDCLAYSYNSVYDFPLPKGKTAKKEEYYSLLILYRQDLNAFAVEQRPSPGLLAGLWQFPMLEGLRETDEIRTYLEDQSYRVSSIHKLKAYRHVFSHLIWNLEPYVAVLGQDFEIDPGNFVLQEANDTIRWLSDRAVMDLAFSSSMTELRDLVVDQKFYLD